MASMFAVRANTHRKTALNLGHKIWVVSDRVGDYVTKSKRGLWETYEEAKWMITEADEIVVEIKNATIKKDGK